MNVIDESIVPTEYVEDSVSEVLFDVRGVATIGADSPDSSIVTFFDQELICFEVPRVQDFDGMDFFVKITQERSDILDVLIKGYRDRVTKAA